MKKSLILALILLSAAFECGFVSIPDDAAPEAMAARFYNKTSKEGGEIFIGGVSVLRIYSSSEAGTAAYDRTERIAERLNEIAASGVPNIFASLEPSMIDNIAVGIVNDMPVFSVEPGDLSGTYMAPLLLSYDWCNRIRRAYGEPLLEQGIFNEIVRIEKLKGYDVEVVKEKKHKAYVKIDGHIVMTFTDEWNDVSAYDKAREAAQNLEDTITEGRGIEDIRPGLLPGNVFTIKLGDMVLSMIGKAKEGESPKSWEKTLEWVNKVRSSLGAQPFSVENIRSSLTQYGKASWYGGFFHGRRTSSGERYDMYELTAAHKKLPFGTEVLVTNLDNKKSVLVRVTDRGPFVAGRIIDLSRSAAEVIGIIGRGVANVRIDILGKSGVNSLRGKGKK